MIIAFLQKIREMPKGRKLWLVPLLISPVLVVSGVVAKSLEDQGSSIASVLVMGVGLSLSAFILSYTKDDKW